MKTKLVILGGGESGVGAAVLAKKEGYEVLLMDEGSLKDGYRNELEKAGIDFPGRTCGGNPVDAGR
jgi:UDP-N-acetylmuramoylalanine--D-glutamate ligase